MVTTNELDNWIGVRADWPVLQGQPWDHLVAVDDYYLRTHALVIGVTGSGKTNLLHQLIVQDIDRGHSVVVLDLRGDLVNTVVELCAQLRVDRARVRIIDLREKHRPFGFNPLSGHGEPYYRALNVLDVVASESESWGVQLAETTRNVLMVLAEIGGSLTDLEAFLYDGAFRAACLERAKSESLIAFWHRYDDLSAERQAALAMPVLNKVSLLLATPTLRRTLGHPNPIDLSAHLNTPGSILLVSLAVDETHASGRMLGSIALSSICREVFCRIDTAESQRNPIRLYVDEFEHFGMQDFEGILAEGRRFALSLVLAHQTLAQLTPRMRSMILNNVGAKFAFRCGREDSATLSRDLFGHPKAYDLCELPVGYAVMWLRLWGWLELEVNEPLIQDGGALSAEARAYLASVYDQAGAYREPDRPISQAIRTASRKPVKKRRSVPETPLEEWLCG